MMCAIFYRNAQEDSHFYKLEMFRLVGWNCAYLILTGSLNLFSKSMHQDREMFMLIDSKELYADIFREFQRMWSDKCMSEPERPSILKRIMRKLEQYIRRMLSC